MQLLLCDLAFDRIRGRLAAMNADLDVVTQDREGVFRRGDTVIDAATVDPHVFWMSLDLYSQGRLPRFVAALLQGTRGQWVQSFSAGIDHPMFKTIMDKGLRLTKSRAQAVAIAEYVVAHGISLLHPIAEQKAAQDAGEWRRVAFREIGASHWVIVGYGSIGAEIARRVKAFGARITVIRRTPQPDRDVDAVVAMDSLPAVLPQADVVVLACALNAGTRNMADAAFFAAVKPGAVLINIGRGDLVDEDALRAALDRDQPGMAVLDVFRTEPLPADAWFWTHPKVRVTAHASNAGDGVLTRGDDQFLENLRLFLDGAPLISEARPDEAGG